MREIKFRAWDKTNKRMINNAVVIDSGGVHQGHRFLAAYESYMQFTGLKDRNGVEIYEGDVVLTQKYYDRPYSQKRKGKRFKGAVEYSIGEGKFGVNDKHVFYSASWRVSRKHDVKYCHGAWGDFLDCEVIGNIYENPELLEG